MKKERALSEVSSNSEIGHDNFNDNHSSTSDKLSCSFEENWSTNSDTVFGGNSMLLLMSSDEENGDNN